MGIEVFQRKEKLDIERVEPIFPFGKEFRKMGCKKLFKPHSRVVKNRLKKSWFEATKTKTKPFVYLFTFVRVK